MNEYAQQLMSRMPQATQAPQMNPWENAQPYAGAPEGEDKTQTITLQKGPDGSVTVTNKVKSMQMDLDAIRQVLTGM